MLGITEGSPQLLIECQKYDAFVIHAWYGWFPVGILVHHLPPVLVGGVRYDFCTV
jgi:hypothetical protein